MPAVNPHVHQRGEMFAQLRADHVAKNGGREVLILQTHVFPVSEWWK